MPKGLFTGELFSFESHGVIVQIMLKHAIHYYSKKDGQRCFREMWIAVILFLKIPCLVINWQF
jgi:hypothetical protein